MTIPNHIEDKNIKEADIYVKAVIPNAAYQKICDDYTIAYYQGNPKGDGHDQIINGINYRTVYTNKHDELINFYGSKQTTIFDFLEE